MGRKPAYNPELAEQICEHLRGGGSLKAWSARPGRPSRETVLKWYTDNIDGFTERYRHARRAGCEARADDLTEEARAAVGKDMAGVQAQRLIVDTNKWILAKLHPEQFGERVMVSGQSDVRVVISLPAKGDDARLINGRPTDLLSAGSEEKDEEDGG